MVVQLQLLYVFAASTHLEWKEIRFSTLNSLIEQVEPCDPKLRFVEVCREN